MNRLPIPEVRTLQPFGVLQRTAIRFYAAHHPHSYAFDENDTKFANRITLNSVRHNLTNYEDVRKELDTTQELKAWRETVHDAIVKRYPQLREAAAEAALRQWI
jgi:hypothetical protein